MSATFLRSFLRQPGQVGAIAPSSPQLAAAMVDWIDWERAAGVVEFGAGTGVFTEAILPNLQSSAKFLAIEKDGELCQLARRRCPQADIVEDSVENVRELCSHRGIPEVNAVICGLPWASFPAPLQTSCLDALAEVMPAGGQFVSFAYWQGMLLPAAHRFRRRLDDYFTEISTSPTVWRNLPPAFIYRCRR